MNRTVLTVLIATLILTLGSTAYAATAVDAVASIEITAGELMIEDDGTNIEFANVDLNTFFDGASSSEEVASTSVPVYTLTDLRGTGEGWHVTFDCPGMVGANATYELGFDNTGGTGTLVKVSGQDVDPVTDGPLMETTLDVDNIYDDGVGTYDGPLMVVNTMENAGMGVYTFTPASDVFNAIIEADEAYAGTYSGTMTATIISGPGGTGSWTGNVE